MGGVTAKIGRSSAVRAARLRVFPPTGASAGAGIGADAPVPAIAVTSADDGSDGDTGVVLSTADASGAESSIAAATGASVTAESTTAPDEMASPASGADGDGIVAL